jgi:hypothetical protein
VAVPELPLKVIGAGPGIVKEPKSPVNEGPLDITIQILNRDEINICKPLMFQSPGLGWLHFVRIDGV